MFLVMVAREGAVMYWSQDGLTSFSDDAQVFNTREDATQFAEWLRTANMWKYLVSGCTVLVIPD
jgi:hypothetical protein